MFEAGIQDNDAGLAFVDLRDASELQGLDGAAEGVAVRLANPLDVESFRAREAAALPADLRYSDWAEDHRNLFNAIHIEKMMMRIILMFIVAVAAFNIVASLMMVVIDKQKDIAILRTCGLESRRVARIFLVQGAMIGFRRHPRRRRPWPLALRAERRCDRAVARGHVFTSRSCRATSTT